MSSPVPPSPAALQSETPPASSDQSPAPLRKVGLIAYPDVVILDIAGPLQAFTSANEECRRRGQPDAYDCRVISIGSTTVRTTSGLEILANHAFDSHPAPDDHAPPYDTLLIAGGRGIDDTLSVPGFLAWLADQPATVRRVGSICTGAFALAGAGLLDGRVVTTHWSRAAELARRFPALTVDANRLHTFGHASDGNDPHVFTSAGITAGIDLALALIEDDLGPSLALAVARRLVMFLRRPGGQAQWSDFLAPDSVAAPRLASLLEWLPSVLSEDLSIPRLAEQAGMSPRTFARVFQHQVGQTPGRYVERLRVEAARAMLQTSEVPLATVARTCGFGRAETLRRAFHRHLSVSPSEYAARFGHLADPDMKPTDTASRPMVSASGD